MRYDGVGLGGASGCATKQGGRGAVLGGCAALAQRPSAAHSLALARVALTHGMSHPSSLVAVDLAQVVQGDVVLTKQAAMEHKHLRQGREGGAAGWARRRAGAARGARGCKVLGLSSSSGKGAEEQAARLKNANDKSRARGQQQGRERAAGLGR
jgi:hypothetical protein